MDHHIIVEIKSCRGQQTVRIVRRSGRGVLTSRTVHIYPIETILRSDRIDSLVFRRKPSFFHTFPWGIVAAWHIHR